MESILLKEQAHASRCVFPLSLALVDGMPDPDGKLATTSSPPDLVQECLALNRGEFDSSLVTTSMNWNDSVLPLLNLKRVMGMEGEALDVVVVRSRNGSRIGLHL